MQRIRTTFRSLVFNARIHYRQGIKGSRGFVKRSLAVTAARRLQTEGTEDFPEGRHTVIVALADPTGLSGGTRLVPVDFVTGFVGANGVPNQLLQSAPSNLSLGARVSFDGMHIVSCERNICELNPIN